MLSSVLSSDKAIEINIAIMRIFVKMRQIVSQETYKIDEIKIWHRALPHAIGMQAFSLTNK
jgi:hypothetical protein